MVLLGDKMSDDEIEELMDEADFHNDGNVRYEDLIKMLMSK